MLATISFSLLHFRLLSKTLKIKIYKTRIVPVVLNGCETWSLTPRAEYRLRVFEKYLDLKREEVAGGWRKQHNEGLHNLYLSPNMEWVGHEARMGKLKVHIKF
jgi:hypothetical protein